MMKTTKKLFTLLLALALPAMASALTPYSYDNYDFELDGIYYKISNDSAWVTYQRWNGDHVSNYWGAVVIPSVITYQGKTYPVTAIDTYAFKNCSGLTSVTIPESIRTIGGSAFYGCTGLTRVIITDLEAWCNADIQFNPLCYAQHLYLNDTEVTDLVIPEGITAIKKYAFQGCTGLKSVTIPSSVTTIGNNAFEDCTGLAAVHIPTSVTSIGECAFEGCTGLTSATLGNAINTINMYTFSGCTALKSIRVPNSITTICTGAFNGCTSLANASLGNSVMTIGNGAFMGCTALSSIEIPNSVAEIGNKAFYGCTSLMSVSIGKSVVTLQKDAFQNAPSIETVICKAVVPPVWNDMSMFMPNVYNHASLHVPCDAERAYKTNQHWGQFLTIIGDFTPDANGIVNGDVNGDGETTIADANSVIDVVIMGGNASHPRTPGKYDENNADVNGDGEITIADVNAVINIVVDLGQ